VIAVINLKKSSMADEPCYTGQTRLPTCVQVCCVP
jgi:hypothetical protein